MVHMQESNKTSLCHPASIRNPQPFDTIIHIWSLSLFPSGIAIHGRKHKVRVKHSKKTEILDMKVIACNHLRKPYMMERNKPFLNTESNKLLRHQETKRHGPAEVNQLP